MARTITGPRAVLGAKGEEVAARLLLDNGMQVLARNWTCSQGEVDIVARDGATLVIVEVKTRRSTRFGSPLEAVTPTKVARLRRLAGAWFAAQEAAQANGRSRLTHARIRNVRIDVVGVWMTDRGPSKIEHLRGVS